MTRYGAQFGPDITFLGVDAVDLDDTAALRISDAHPKTFRPATIRRCAIIRCRRSACGMSMALPSAVAKPSTS